MEQRGTGNPYFSTSQPPENHIRNLYAYQNSPDMASSSSTDQSQTLLSAFANLNLSSNFVPHNQTSSFGLPPATSVDVRSFGGDPLMGSGSYPMGLTEQPQQPEVSNVGLMRASQNGGMPYFGGPYLDYSVSPVPGMNLGVSGVGNGGGVGGTLSQRGYNGLYDYPAHDPFMQYTKQLPGYTNSLYPNSLHNGVYNGSIDNLLSKVSIFTKPNPYNPYSTKPIPQLKPKIEMFSIEEVKGEIVSLAKDQSGSKILQSKLEIPNEKEIELVVSEIIECVTDLMKNQYGSYFMQKLFGVCNEEQRTRIIVSLTDTSYQFVGVCISPHGTKALQKLLENLNTPEQISLVMSAISPGVVLLANDPNGQHIVQFCVKHFSYEYNKHVLSEIAENCFVIATDKSGCCVIQACLDHSHGEPQERLIRAIIANASQLTEHSYGNYVVQHLLGLGIYDVVETIVRRLQGCFISLACNKYASNVVEKLIKSGEEHSTRVILELLSSPNASMLLIDPFGNYVIQLALSSSKGSVHNALLNLIRMNASSMRSNIYGKKILAWLEKKKAPLVFR